MLLRIIIFALINFGALALGGIATGKGVPSDWYQNLIKAPWTPPGWVFGAAWTTIMVCFSIYAAMVWTKTSNKSFFLILFGIQFMLNVMWNPVFFQFHAVAWGLFIIISLTALVFYLLIHYHPLIGLKGSLLIAPYFIWLIIATSLNWYILVKN